MTRRAAIEAMVERAMERALASLVEIYRDQGVAQKELDRMAEFVTSSPAPRLTPEQKREKANAYMRAYKERKKVEKESRRGNPRGEDSSAL